ncbi:MAG TPA: hypothetical protein PLV51_12710 [Lentimicrobium sp.]|nr:hypothetical protein [Lentimicrobium sp.]
MNNKKLALVFDAFHPAKEIIWHPPQNATGTVIKSRLVRLEKVANLPYWPVQCLLKEVIKLVLVTIVYFAAVTMSSISLSTHKQDVRIIMVKGFQDLLGRYLDLL